MKVLGIDTSTFVSSIALLEAGEVVGDFNLNQEKTHSESLAPMIQELLDGLGYRLEDIDLFAIGTGPGSFTGLRIGMTFAKTFGQVLDKPVVGLSTLKAIGYAHTGDGHVLALSDARGGRYYYALYRKEGQNLVELIPDSMDFAEDISLDIKGEDLTVCGFYNDEDIPKLPAGAYLRSYRVNPGRNIAFLGEKLYKEGHRDDLYQLVPNYVRLSQAERDLKRIVE